jgi:hypothetical protein
MMFATVDVAVLIIRAIAWWFFWCFGIWCVAKWIETHAEIIEDDEDLEERMKKWPK